ncbi:hypothetical protein ABZY20_32545 [Streptomyces sp. NPDC006624]|uniref:hypothetical protein n=1 Tax=Streptomyces sp. NPDC006624 TaxID=3154892 RepID=UPI0033B13583
MSRANGTGGHAAEVAGLWREHLRAAFPAALRGAEPAGIDLVLLDAAVAGCVSAWRNDGGALDGERHRVLRACIEDLDRVLPTLGEPEDRRYWKRLRRLAVLVSDTRPGE